ncbi:MAG: hypothetical protein IPI67_19550 [Myxococcales bacterium]|nr:hypothetical protein [Myxococcales bacterium]
MSARGDTGSVRAGRRRVFAIAIVIAAYASIAGCTSSDEAQKPSVVQDAGVGASATIGPAGGTVALANGAFSIEIPPGALTTDTLIKILPVASPPSGAQGPAYDLQPQGLAFLVPVRLTFQVSADAPTPLSALRVARHESGSWQPVGASEVGSESSRLSAETQHFSLYSYLKFSCSTHADCKSPERCLDDGNCGIPCGPIPSNECPAFTNCVDGRCVVQSCVTSDACGWPHKNCIAGLSSAFGTCGAPRCNEDSNNAVSQLCTPPGTHELACYNSPGSLDGACWFIRCDGGTPCPSGYACLFGDCVDENAGCVCGTNNCPCSAGSDAGVDAASGGAGGTLSTGGAGGGGGTSASGGTGTGGASGGSGGASGGAGGADAGPITCPNTNFQSCTGPTVGYPGAGSATVKCSDGVNRTITCTGPNGLGKYVCSCDGGPAVSTTGIFCGAGGNIEANTNLMCAPTCTPCTAEASCPTGNKCLPSGCCWPCLFTTLSCNADVDCCAIPGACPTGPSNPPPGLCATIGNGCKQCQVF